MSLTLEQLMDAASELPPSEREELAEFLLHSLNGEETEIRSAWLTLAKERMAEVKAGNVVGIPAEDVIQRRA